MQQCHHGNVRKHIHFHPLHQSAYVAYFCLPSTTHIINKRLQNQINTTLQYLRGALQTKIGWITATPIQLQLTQHLPN